MRLFSILWTWTATLALACDKGDDSSGEESDADTDADADTDTDTDTDADPNVCGDGVVADKEDCDDKGESAECDADCTFVECGDGTLNSLAEVCEITSTEPWARCQVCTAWGAGLDGTYGHKWETMNEPDPKAFAHHQCNIAGLQEFHYSGEPYFYDVTNSARYDIANDVWTHVDSKPTFGSCEYWPNGAVDASGIWVPWDSAMHFFDFKTETWTALKGKIPDGAEEEGGAVFDGDGFIWYHGPGEELVRYNTADGTTTSYKHRKFDAYETRMAYDPVANRIVFSGFENKEGRFLIFDLAKETFTDSSVSPGGFIHDNTCHDRSGGIYTGASNFYDMFRYDITTDTWTLIPAPTVGHDYNSTCVVSQDGWLYYTNQGPGYKSKDSKPEGYSLLRLALGKVE